MVVRLWGVRGSSPTPLAPEELRSKFAAILQRAKASDLENSETRQRFLSRLPRGLFGTAGGNTACIEVRTKQNACIILDTGTGLRELEKRLKRERDSVKEFHIFLSHFHYDHLLGLPYFNLLYDPTATVIFYSPYPAMERILDEFMRAPYHPVGWDSFAADIGFCVLAKNEKVTIGGAEVSWIRRNHPNGCAAYKVKEGNRSFIYSTDTELTEKDFERTERNLAFFYEADAIILDAQYTLGEAIEKYNWGHSSYSLAVEFCREFHIKKLYLYHHEPLNDDADMEKILRSAILFDNRLENGGPLEIDLAREGHVFEL
ncbi:MAG: MBL fold metallo-hydrolase [Spirochaetales bacterium]|nr:MBL fold metallo-hydrolase [Spirochaetales bacterium]